MHDFNYVNGKLYCEEVRIEKIAMEIGTPFYLYSYQTIFNHYNAFKKALKEIDPLICYAYKANSNSAICKIFARAGGGAEVVSGGELRQALEVGVSPEKIVFSGNGKTEKEIGFALKSNILMFDVDSEMELRLLNKVSHSLKKRAKVVLRVNPDLNPQTHPYLATGLKESKFGFDFNQALDGYKLARDLENIKVAGIHMHIGSQITSLKPFVEGLDKVISLIGELKKIGIATEYINVGGGLGIVYLDEEPPCLDNYARVVISKLSGLNIKGIFEPGRVLMGNAGILVSKVLYRKETAKKTFIVVDSGMNDFVRPAFYQAKHRIEPVVKKEEKEEVVDIVGPICESADFFARDKKFPRVETGELLSIFGAGAYGFSMASNYNFRCRPAEVLVSGENYFVIRQRETYEDLIKNEKMPDILET
ncbi:diaminopimelate decarboxylase [bacterium]|nr:diaminopimelate decarboxylase [bacterium]